MSVELLVREGDTWRWRELTGPDAVLELAHLDVGVALRDVYEDVVFEEAERTEE